MKHLFIIPLCIIFLSCKAIDWSKYDVTFDKGRGSYIVKQAGTKDHYISLGADIFAGVEIKPERQRYLSARPFKDSCEIANYIRTAKVIFPESRFHIIDMDSMRNSPQIRRY